ncbi:MAG: N-acetyltransferase family protein [Candidatus Eisenbacteria bacterium]
MTPAPSIRAAQDADLPALTALYNHYVETNHCTFDATPLSVELRRVWFDQHAEGGPHRLLVAVRGDALLGYASSSAHRPKPGYLTSVETSVYLAPEAHGQGLGTRLYTELFGQLANEDVHRALAGVALPNPASVALHRRMGFSELGTFDEVGRKFDRYWSVQWFQRALP